MDIDTHEHRISISLELASYRYELTRFEHVRIDGGPGYLDIFDDTSRRIIAISECMRGDSPLILTDIPARLGLPGGTYDPPCISEPIHGGRERAT